MTFSDAIYGKEESGRYVCESRLNKMLNKESGLTYEKVRNTYENFRSRCIATIKEKEKIHKKAIVK